MTEAERTALLASPYQPDRIRAMKEPIPLLGPEIYGGIEEKGFSEDIFTGWHSTLPFIKQVVDLANPQVIVEVGTWKGGSAIHMASLCTAHIYCVDHWLGGCDHITAECAFRQGVHRDRHGWPGIYYQFLQNVKSRGLERRITPVPMMTTDGAALLSAHHVRADLIYIDADHHKEPCKADILAYRPLLRPGGIMFGDDFYLGDVKDAVFDVFGFRPQIIDSTGNFWAIQLP